MPVQTIGIPPNKKAYFVKVFAELNVKGIQIQNMMMMVMLTMMVMMMLVMMVMMVMMMLVTMVFKLSAQQSSDCYWENVNRGKCSLSASFP